MGQNNNCSSFFPARVRLNINTIVGVIRKASDRAMSVIDILDCSNDSILLFYKLLKP